LIKNLLELGVEKSLVKVILSFLTDRSGFVDIEGNCSNLVKITYGCVQGSVLGPILFNIYVRELQSIVGLDTFCVSYADDSYSAITTDKNKINDSLVSLGNIATSHLSWLERLGMVSNADKTEFVAFGYQGPPLPLSLITPLLTILTPLKFLVLCLSLTFHGASMWIKQSKNAMGWDTC